MAAIGPLATGVIAVGQLARGIIVVGQLAIGVIAFGQLAVGAAWAGGQLAVAAVQGPSLIGVGAVGALRLGDLVRLRLGHFHAHRLGGRRRWVAPLIITAVVVLVWFVALAPLFAGLWTREPIGATPTPPHQLR